MTCQLVIWLVVVVAISDNAHAEVNNLDVKAVDSGPAIIVHSGTHSNDDYSLELLRLVLQKAGNRYQAQALGYWPPRGRDFAMMEHQDGIDIMWGSARQDREDRFLTIRIPIFKGLIGWRIPLVHASNQNMFKNIADLGALSNYRPGQYFSWTDTKILTHNGIDVFEVNNRTSLMDMLVDKKFDYYPRATIEIMNEYREHKHLGVVIDDNILIVYPTAFYFYVHKDNHALAENLTQGLEAIIASGEMDTLFVKHFGKVLNELHIANRKVIRLSNPYIPEKAPFARKELWLDPENLPDFITE